jgi:hypothetical protein
VSRRYREIWYSLAAIAAITALYVLAYRQAGTFPVASSLVGHGIGIVGFILMLMTATLYTVRKRMTDARWGSMAAWLRFHMVTGLVGPYMVFLHTSMRFWGLAGVAMLLTVVVVTSGLIGRYLYTAVPRTVEDGVSDAVVLDRLLARYSTRQTAAAGAPTTSSVHAVGGSPEASGPPTTADASLERSRMMRIDRLVARRKALSIWRSIHLPLTWALFVTAFVHMVGALYYELGR